MSFMLFMVRILDVLQGADRTGPRLASVSSMLSVHRDPVASTIIGAAIEVHRCMGPGLMEGVYQMCLAHELRQRGLDPNQEVSVPVMFKGIRMERGFRLDFLVNGCVIVEVK